MKNIIELINEVASMDPKNLIKNLKFDFSETSRMPINTKEERAEKAKAQEAILVDVINNAQDEYKAIGIKDYCKSINKQYSYKLDSMMGDVILMKDENPIMFIDLKVSHTNNYLGTPDMLSLVNFGSIKYDKKYYLCSNIDGTNTKLVLANDVYNNIISRKGIMIASRDRKNISEEVRKLTDKVKVIAPKGMEDADTSKLYNEDFVATNVIQRL